MKTKFANQQFQYLFIPSQPILYAYIFYVAFTCYPTMSTYYRTYPHICSAWIGLVSKPINNGLIKRDLNSSFLGGFYGPPQSTLTPEHFFIILQVLWYLPVHRCSIKHPALPYLMSEFSKKMRKLDIKLLKKLLKIYCLFTACCFLLQCIILA